jgi:hypothetical protein
MKKVMSLLFILTLVLSVFHIAVQQTAADILPRVRCHFSKGVYAYGEPVMFYLDVDVFPNTLLGGIYLEEVKPDGSSNTVDFGVLDQGSYQFTIGQAGPPPGYRQCTLVSRKNIPTGFDDIMRWQGGYVVEAGPTSTSTPAPVSTSTPPERPILTQSRTSPIAGAPIEQWALPLLIILAVGVTVLVLILSKASSKQTKT